MRGENIAPREGAYMRCAEKGSSPAQPRSGRGRRRHLRHDVLVAVGAHTLRGHAPKGAAAAARGGDDHGGRRARVCGKKGRQWGEGGVHGDCRRGEHNTNSREAAAPCSQAARRTAAAVAGSTGAAAPEVRHTAAAVRRTAAAARRRRRRSRPRRPGAAARRLRPREGGKIPARQRWVARSYRCLLALFAHLRCVFVRALLQQIDGYTVTASEGSKPWQTPRFPSSPAPVPLAPPLLPLPPSSATPRAVF